MNKLIAFIEKGKPFFENYLVISIFVPFVMVSLQVCLLFSSHLSLSYSSFVPNSWGFKWSDEVVAFLMKPL